MSPQNQQKPDDTGNSLLRLVDPRVPLPWVIAVIVVAAGAYWQLQALKEAVTDLQITVRAGNQNYAGLLGEQALIKFRLSNVEDEAKTTRATVQAMQGRK